MSGISIDSLRWDAILDAFRSSGLDPRGITIVVHGEARDDAERLTDLEALDV
jgi:hypothetical protein